MATKIALVGIGKIATDQHVPALQNNPNWSLAATCSRSGTVDGVETFQDMDEMLAARPDIPVVSLCLPPVPRFEYAKKAIEAGRHVMLEKPPGATISEVQILSEMAEQAGVVLFATWHSRMACGVRKAKDWLSKRSISAAQITWNEDVRQWHPGQSWIFEPGGMGVLDPVINAISILTEIMPNEIHLQRAQLKFPKNAHTPIAADLQFSKNVSLTSDWRHTGDPEWSMTFTANDGVLALHEGGGKLSIDGAVIDCGENREYPALYERMTDLIKSWESDVDLRPLVLISDAMTVGSRETVEAFHF